MDKHANPKHQYITATFDKLSKSASDTNKFLIGLNFGGRSGNKLLHIDLRNAFLLHETILNKRSETFDMFSDKSANWLRISDTDTVW